MSVSLFACGDIISSTYNEHFVDSKLKEIISSSDIAICNFEAPVYINDMRPIKKAGPSIFQSSDFIKALRQAGFNFASLANNHIYDYGKLGLEKTIDELQKNGLSFVGAGLNFAQAYSPRIIEKDGITIGFIAACENGFGCLYENESEGGYAWIFNDIVEDNIRSLKNKCDFVVLLAHAGVEDIHFPIKEWRMRYKRLCDIGVDVVIGHHPHVPQGYEKYNDSLIFYSLGNFYFDRPRFRGKTNDSYSIILYFSKNIEIRFKTIFHKKIENTTCLVDKEDVNFSLLILNSLLNKNYEEENNKICIDLFNKYYFNHYQIAINSVPTNGIIGVATFFIKRLLFNKAIIREKNLLLLLHNIKIDSVRFVVQRALETLLKTD